MNDTILPEGVLFYTIWTCRCNDSGVNLQFRICNLEFAPPERTVELTLDNKFPTGACSTWGRPRKQPRISLMRLPNLPNTSHFGPNSTGF